MLAKIEKKLGNTPNDKELGLSPMKGLCGFHFNKRRILKNW